MVSRTGAPPSSDLRTSDRVIIRERGLTIFDAETQDTSYGIVMIDGMPHIFDTHRKDGIHVSTIEVLTEVRTPVRVPRATLNRFLRRVERIGLLPIPYSACFFEGNLHVYAFFGPVVGLDLSAFGPTVPQAERNLEGKANALWPYVPREIMGAQLNLLEGRREPRHRADLEVLARRYRDAHRKAAQRTKR